MQNRTLEAALCLNNFWGRRRTPRPAHAHIVPLFLLLLHPADTPRVYHAGGKCRLCAASPSCCRQHAAPLSRHSVDRGRDSSEAGMTRAVRQSGCPHPDAGPHIPLKAAGVGDHGEAPFAASSLGRVLVSAAPIVRSVSTRVSPVPAAAGRRRSLIGRRFCF